MPSTSSAIVTLLIGIFIFFICREVMCWYWKMNDTVGLLTDIKDLLSTIKSQNTTFQQALNNQGGGSPPAIRDERAYKVRTKLEGGVIRISCGVCGFVVNDDDSECLGCKRTLIG